MPGPLSPARYCIPTSPPRDRDGAAVGDAIPGCGTPLVVKSYCDRHGKTRTLRTCPKCDSLHLWPKK